TPQRNRQILALKNTWRAAHDLPPLPEPELPKISPIEPAKVQPLLDSLLAARTPQEQHQKMDAIVELGLGAIPAVKSRAAKLPKDSDGFKTLDALLKRLSLIARQASGDRL